MKAEIISIGDELLIGQVVNSNASWLADELNKVGVEIVQITVVADDTKEIIRSFSEAQSRADLIITTGGLGPTRDDKTHEAVCEFFDTKLVESKQVLENIKGFFIRRGLKISVTNRSQALVPEIGKIIPNKNGTAPGILIEKNGKTFIVLPGVPFELKPMMTNYVIPDLIKKINGSHRIHRTILTHGIGESFLSDKLNRWELELPAGIKAAYLPSPGIVRLRISGKGKDFDLVKKEVDQTVERLKDIIPGYVFGEEDDTLQSVVSNLLKIKGCTLSIAESCTGGAISHLLTGIPGASQFFSGSIIAYDNNIKINQLGVDKSLIARYGAVSQQVAEAMASGIREKLQTDYSISTTGIAGPTGGTADKPVGLVWIAVAQKDCVISKKYLFGHNRERNITITSLSALNMLRESIKSDHGS